MYYANFQSKKIKTQEETGISNKYGCDSLE